MMKIILVNLAVFVAVIFFTILLLFFMGSGSGGFNEKWYLLYILFGTIHCILLGVYIVKLKNNYLYIIPFSLFILYLLVYFFG
ncbi:hypothetical protein UJ101_01913 [Flavobacteriaceae bacterium UJ101]|nr:hypothetical protein UJ101_01913 [Flavobacteriaceae bacterium UJ101]